MLYSNLPQPTDEETDLYLASLMIKEYGDLLKISRSSEALVCLFPHSESIFLKMNIYCKDMKLT